ncbi:MAG: tripartite tricarboxylate transporter substrate binding protein [Pseudomonadota bacterium]
MSEITRRQFSRIAGAALATPAILGSVSARANTFPSRTVTIVVPFQPGGSNDIIARLVGQAMAEEYKSAVVVENRPGASGVIGAKAVLSAEPDGHTVLIASSGVLTINQWLFKDLGYDPEKDFAPLTLATRLSNVLVVNPTMPVKSLAELVAYAKANPGKVSFASMGSGTTGHLCGEMFKKMAGVDIVHVPYKGSAPALNDLLGGQVQMMFDNLPTALPHIQGGKLRALAVTGSDRRPQVPDVPTIRESGYPEFIAEAWFGFVAPAKVPAPVRERLANSMIKALQQPKIKEQLENLAAQVVANTPQEFATYIASESRKWKKVVEESGAKIDG